MSAKRITDIKAFGFEVAVARKDLKNQMFTVCFENEITVKETTIDVKKYDFENSPRGRMMQTLSLSRRKENRKIIREKGFSYFVKFVQNQMDVEQDDYETWLKMHQPNAKELKKQRKTKFVYEPKISIVIPLFNTPIRYLDELLVSIASQTYANWELCLADGSTKKEVGDFIRQKYGKEKRIRYQKLEENNGIAGNTNAAVAMATGDYVMLCDHDDLVAVDALYEMVSVLNEDSSTDIIYTDEDKVNSDTTMYFSPNFKPDFNFVRLTISAIYSRCVRRFSTRLEDSAKTSTERRISILFCGAVRRQQRSRIFRRFSITGEAMKTPQQEIRTANSMRSMPENARSRSITPVSMPRYAIRVFSSCLSLC